MTMDEHTLNTFMIGVKTASLMSAEQLCTLAKDDDLCSKFFSAVYDNGALLMPHGGIDISSILADQTPV